MKSIKKARDKGRHAPEQHGTKTADQRNTDP